MKFLHIALIALLFAATSCGQKADKTAETSPQAEPLEVPAIEDTDPEAAQFEAERLVNTVYSMFVFDLRDDADPRLYFTPEALQKLADAYEFDCDEGTCYAFDQLRTPNQDVAPDSEEESAVVSVTPESDGWFLVTFTDMGWPGKTRVKITDGKISDYARL